MKKQIPPGVIKYGVAVSKWVASKMPKRSEEEIARIYKICTQCDMFDKDGGKCSGCGCRVNQSNNPLANKIAMGTEKCPYGRW